MNPKSIFFIISFDLSKKKTEKQNKNNSFKMTKTYSSVNAPWAGKRYSKNINPPPISKKGRISSSDLRNFSFNEEKNLLTAKKRYTKPTAVLESIVPIATPNICHPAFINQ
jgi:hypothetical protein